MKRDGLAKPAIMAGGKVKTTSDNAPSVAIVAFTISTNVSSLENTLTGRSPPEKNGASQRSFYYTLAPVRSSTGFRGHKKNKQGKSDGIG
ncbi:MAG: hypothetical protein ACOY4H_13200 [Thermodesulfobacteriota bacterium]